jgi:hypothetical protein
VSIKQINKDYNEPYYEEVIKKLPDDESFQIGQSYDNRTVTTLSCAKCGGKEFTVGRGSWFTAIKCPKCQWELCIHNG